MKQIYEYDLNTAEGLRDLIVDRVFKLTKTGVPAECWSALAELTKRAGLKTTEQELRGENKELHIMIDNSIKDIGRVDAEEILNDLKMVYEHLKEQP